MTLEEQLTRQTTGEVLFDRFNRGRYATDASFYQIMPAGVVVPRTMDEALRALTIARDAGRRVLPAPRAQQLSRKTACVCELVDVARATASECGRALVAARTTNTRCAAGSPLRL